MTDPADPTPVVSGDTTNLRRRRAGTASPRMVLLVTSAAAFLSSLDLFIVNIAFPAIRADLAGTDLGDLSWVLNGYTVVFAAFLPLSGRLADRYGHRFLFLLGLAVFTVASAACALAPSVWTLVGARMVQAVGAAFVVPTSLSLPLLPPTPERRSYAVACGPRSVPPPRLSVHRWAGMARAGWWQGLPVNAGRVIASGRVRVLPGPTGPGGMPDLSATGIVVGSVPWRRSGPCPGQRNGVRGSDLWGDLVLLGAHVGGCVSRAPSVPVLPPAWMSASFPVVVAVVLCCRVHDGVWVECCCQRVTC